MRLGFGGDSAGIQLRFGGGTGRWEPKANVMGSLLLLLLLFSVAMSFDVVCRSFCRYWLFRVLDVLARLSAARCGAEVTSVDDVRVYHVCERRAMSVHRGTRAAADGVGGVCEPLSGCDRGGTRRGVRVTPGTPGL